jgi:hypothetical protein
MDYAALSQATVAFLTPYFLNATGKLIEGGLDAAREKTVAWLKSKFTKPAQVGALEVAAKAPGDADALEALRHQVERALQHDEAFRKELIEMLPEEAIPPDIAQNMSISGSGSIGVQSAGSGNIVIQK